VGSPDATPKMKSEAGEAYRIEPRDGKASNPMRRFSTRHSSRLFDYVVATVAARAGVDASVW
jgi:hypothetical protein